MASSSKLAAPLTCLVAGSLGAVYALLQLRVGLHRFGTNILFGASGDNGKEDPVLTAKSRAGGNMGEFAPIGVLLMLLLETATDAPKPAVATFGAALLVSRLTHAFALSTACNPKIPHLPIRAPSFITTVVALVGAGSYLGISALKSLRK